MGHAFMIRGQSSGVMHDKVYLRHPTDEELNRALAHELALHGIDPKAQGGPKPRTRWVQVQLVETVGSADGAPAPKDMKQITGQLSQAAVDAMVKSGPPPASGGGVGAGVAGEITMAGTGSVVNPGEPGHVDTLTPADVTTLDR